jgi:hypothetical protein
MWKGVQIWDPFHWTQSSGITERNKTQYSLWSLQGPSKFLYLLSTNYECCISNVDFYLFNLTFITYANYYVDQGCPNFLGG